MSRRLPKRYRNGKDDCLRRCVARVTRRKLHDVPHFLALYGSRWSYYLMSWCQRTGHQMIFARRGALTLSGNILRWINIGKTRDGVYHAVVMEARNRGAEAKVVWDGGFPLRSVRCSLVIQKARAA